MMYLATVLRNKIKDTIQQVQIVLFGRAREVQQSLPYGIDSAPNRDMVAVYANTGEMGNSVIIGYLYKNAIAETGSIRMYSDGAYIHLRQNGDIELGGDADNAIRYAAFNTVMQNYLTALNLAITTGVSSAGGGYTAPPAPDFTTAKIDKIKTL